MIISKKTIGYIACITATFFAGIHPIISKILIQEGVPTLNIAIVRLWGGALFLLFFILGVKKNKLQFKKFSFDWVFWLGVLGFACDILFFQKALEFTTATHTKVIETFAPVFVLIIGIFLFSSRFKVLVEKRKITHLFLIIVLASIGTSLIFLESKHESFTGISLQGDLLASVTAISFAIFLLANSEIRKRSSSHSLVITLFFLFFSGFLIVPFVDLQHFLMLNLHQCLLLSFMAVFCTALTYFLWSYSAHYLKVSTISILFNLTLVFTLLFEWTFLHTFLTWKVLLATGLIVISAIYSEKVMSIKKN